MKLAAPFGVALTIGATLLIACSAAPTLTGKPWALTAVTSKTPAFQAVVPDFQQPDYAITFNTDGTYSGTAACNHIAGTYKTSGSTLTITPGASTLAFCNYRVIGSFDFGSIFAHPLPAASTYVVASDTLTITLTDGGTITFGPPPVVPSGAESTAVESLAPGASPPAELVGKVWKLTAITELVPAFQGVVPEADESKYTIEFRADGTFNVRADCNEVSGTYALYRGDSQPGPLESGGGGVTILAGPSPLAGCAPGSIGDLYVVGLSNLSTFRIDGDQLTLSLRDGGKLVFGG